MTKLEFPRRGDKAPYSFAIVIDGVERAEWSPSGGKGYWLHTLDNEGVRNQHYSPWTAETKSEFEAQTLLALETGKIPTPEGYEQRKQMRRDKLAAKVADWKQARMAERFALAGPRMVQALQDAVKIADIAADEWDKEPRDGMKCGKLLLALAGHIPGYRKDTDDIHMVIKEMLQPAPEPNEYTRETFIRDVKQETNIWGPF